jgi:hypothetical protein
MHSNKKYFKNEKKMKVGIQRTTTRSGEQMPEARARRRQGGGRGCGGAGAEGSGGAYIRSNYITPTPNLKQIHSNNNLNKK